MYDCERDPLLPSAGLVWGLKCGVLWVFERGAMTAEGEHVRGMFVLHLPCSQLCGLSFLGTAEHYSYILCPLSNPGMVGEH